MFSEF